jgi:hypothetical protein
MFAILLHRFRLITQRVKEDEREQTVRNARSLALMSSLIEQIKVRDITAEDWEDHELGWQAHLAETRAALVESMSKMMLSLEAIARREPEKVSPALQEELHWWQDKGGRESMLGELSIEVRRRLERKRLSKGLARCLWNNCRPALRLAGFNTRWT